MKKLNPKYKQYLLRISEYRIKKDLKEARNRYKSKSKSRIRLLKNRQKTLIKISAPENFALEFTPEDSKLGYAATRYKLLSFIERVKRSLTNNLKVHITFKNTKLLAPSGTLIFVAELERVLQQFPGKVTIDYPDDDVVEQLFQHIGLLKRLNMTSRKVITAENVRHWDYVYGVLADATEFKRLFHRYATSISEDVRSGLFDSMSEAVTNSIQHAYPCDHKDKCDCKKGWWMFAKQVDRKLTVVMYDMGIGIPTSLKRKPELMELLISPVRKIRKRADTALIDIAIESSRTSTRLPHRGKGLPNMLEFVKNSNIGVFKIFSNAGAFYYSAEDGIESGSDYSTPIIGTLIAWEIPLITERDEN